MSAPKVRHLAAGDRDIARALFAMMADVFEEGNAPLGDAYLDALLSSDSFWALAALEADAVVGGLTAHVLSMTRAEASEIFIYDVAVRADRQRRGVGRLLIEFLRREAASAGIDVLFVPADDEDVHALDFYRALGGAPSPVTFFTFS